LPEVATFVEERHMSLSRRHFLKHSTLSAATVPLLVNLDIDYCQAATGAPVDLSMGFPDGAMRLNFNENVLGPSPKAIEGASAALAESFRYALAGLLRPLVAEHHGIDEDWVLMGTGSTELVRMAPLAYLRDGGNVVSSLVTWRGLLSVAEHMGRTLKRVDYLKSDGWTYDVDGLLAAVDSETRIVSIVTPNNPTGTHLRDGDYEKIASALPEHVLLVLDEAYAHYLPDGSKTGLDLIKAGYKNVLVTRTFSKAHGLAGLRCGYGIANPDILTEFKKFGCGPGSVNIVAYGAIQGALSDPEHPKRSRDYVRKCRAFYEREFSNMGLGKQVVSGPPPFILVELGEQAESIREELRRRKILVGSGRSWNAPHFMRISYGFEHENEAFFKELKAII